MSQKVVAIRPVEDSDRSWLRGARAVGGDRHSLVAGRGGRGLPSRLPGGWELVALHRDAVTAWRALKPEIPDVGDYGLPIRHELEFELSTST